MKFGFNHEDWKSISDTRILTPKQIFLVSGTYFSNDGFGDQSPVTSFCYSWLSHPEVNFITGTYRGRPQMTTEGAGAGFQKCDAWQYQVNWTGEQLRQPQNQANGQQ